MGCIGNAPISADFQSTANLSQLTSLIKLRFKVTVHKIIPFFIYLTYIITKIFIKIKLKIKRNTSFSITLNAKTFYNQWEQCPQAHEVLSKLATNLTFLTYLIERLDLTRFNLI